MSDGVDVRSMRTRKLLRESLLDAIQHTPFRKITVSGICDVAGIGRGTFYGHYHNMEEVLRDLLFEALNSGERTVQSCGGLTSGHYVCPYAICDRVRENPRYAALFFDESAASLVVEIISDLCRDAYVHRLSQTLGIHPDDAVTVFNFQLNGCLAINRESFRRGDMDLEHNRDLIGMFIQGGLSRIS